jgi:hypothetical protein
VDGWGTTRRESHDLCGRLRETAHGFLRFGAAYWPGADHFDLLELDAEGSCTGDARDVCRCCVREAAAIVEARAQCDGGAAVLDLVGSTSPQDGPCSICGSCPDA